MNRKELGKIKSVEIGEGGYQDAMFGISFTLGGDSWGVGDFKGYWRPEQIDVTEYTQWTEKDRSKVFDETMRYISKLLHDAKKRFVSELKGVPVEVEFEGNALKSWRILTEVL